MSRSNPLAGQKNWFETMLDQYKEGKSDLEVCKALGITRKQFQKYCEDPRFKDIVDWGHDLAEAWWEEQSRINLQNKDFNTNLFKARMQKFYGWADKVDNANKNVNSEVDLKRLQEELAERLPELMKLVPSEKLSLPNPNTGD